MNAIELITGKIGTKEYKERKRLLLLLPVFLVLVSAMFCSLFIIEKGNETLAKKANNIYDIPDAKPEEIRNNKIEAFEEKNNDEILNNDSIPTIADMNMEKDKKPKLDVISQEEVANLIKSVNAISSTDNQVKQPSANNTQVIDYEKNANREADKVIAEFEALKPNPSPIVNNTIKENIESENSKPIEKETSAFNTFKAVGEEKEKEHYNNKYKKIHAMIMGDQKIENNSTVSIRLSETAVLSGNNVLQKNKIITGYCQLQDGRVSIKFQSVQTDKELVDFPYSVYDMDGMEGLRVMSTRLDKSTIESEINGINATLDKVTGVIKKLSSKGNNQEEKINLPDGYRIILKIKNND